MISVCAICGDEEVYFSPWVKHLQRVKEVKEINVVYNKAMPPEISGINYKQVETHYNFSEWRNESLAMATEDWILVLDIDEFLSYELIEQLSSLMEQGDFIKAHRIDFWNKDEYRKDLTFSKYYLFKNSPDMFYARPLHEELCVKHGDKMEDVHPVSLIEDKIKVVTSESPVYHYSFIKRKDEGTDRLALYKTIRYLNAWNYGEGNKMNEFSREDLKKHIERESEKGMVLEKFTGKHPEELKEIL